MPPSQLGTPKIVQPTHTDVIFLNKGVVVELSFQLVSKVAPFQHPYHKSFCLTVLVALDRL
jgi:hypothetical protein